MNMNNQEVSYLIKQIARTMGMSPVSAIDGAPRILMDEGWSVSWSNGYEPYVVISFDDEISPQKAAVIAVRFSRILDFLDVKFGVQLSVNDSDSISTIESTVLNQ